MKLNYVSSHKLVLSSCNDLTAPMFFDKRECPTYLAYHEVKPVLDLHVLDLGSLCVCAVVCVQMPAKPLHLYSLSMEGMFARANPQLVFLFELLQAHCTYLEEKGRVWEFFSWRTVPQKKSDFCCFSSWILFLQVCLWAFEWGTENELSRQTRSRTPGKRPRRPTSAKHLTQILPQWRTSYIQLCNSELDPNVGEVSQSVSANYLWPQCCGYKTAAFLAFIFKVQVLKGDHQQHQQWTAHWWCN